MSSYSLSAASSDLAITSQGTWPTEPDCGCHNCVRAKPAVDPWRPVRQGLAPGPDSAAAIDEQHWTGEEWDGMVDTVYYVDCDLMR